ncbi:hypothetical protein [Pseudomonas sp. FEN]|nr:hypothetical protein [Pseudomonas sp. FEN]
MPHHVEKSRHGLYYLRLPKRLAHFNDGIAFLLFHWVLKRLPKIE